MKTKTKKGRTWQEKTAAAETAAAELAEIGITTPDPRLLELLTHRIEREDRHVLRHEQMRKKLGQARCTVRLLVEALAHSKRVSDAELEEVEWW